jgi:hypothetical protein
LQAPERLGLIVGRLAKLGVVRLEMLQQFCNERCEELAADEYGPSIEEVKEIYDKFLNEVSRTAGL